MTRNIHDIYISNCEKVRVYQEAHMSALEKIELPTYDEIRQVFIDQRVNEVMKLVRAELTKENVTDVYDPKSRRPTIRLDIPYDLDGTPEVKAKLTEEMAKFGWQFTVSEIQGNVAFWHMRLYVYLYDNHDPK